MIGHGTLAAAKAGIIARNVGRFSDRRSPRPRTPTDHAIRWCPSLPRLSARVIVTHGRLLRVRTASGRGVAGARPRPGFAGSLWRSGRRASSDARHAELRIATIAPRTGALYRSNARGQGELIAANLTLLRWCVAPLPQPDLFIVDRYLCAAQCAGHPCGGVAEQGRAAARRERRGRASHADATTGFCSCCTCRR